MRNFVFKNINTLSMCPFMPYHDKERSYVNYWFASSDGDDLNSFLTLLSERQQDKLENEGGLCIVYTHFAKGFVSDGTLNQEFKRLMERLSQRQGWFVPASNILDYLLQVKGHYEIADDERAQLERKWLLEKMKRNFND